MIALLLPLMIMSDPVPIAGRPADFSGAVGGPFVVTMAVDKNEVKVGEPIKLTITISGPGDLSKVKRPDLKNDPAWTAKFVVEDASTEPTTNQLTFTYRIRLKHDRVGLTPRVRFTYFNPAIQPSNLGWQVTYGKPIELETETLVAKHVQHPSQMIEWLNLTTQQMSQAPGFLDRARSFLDFVRGRVDTHYMRMRALMHVKDFFVSNQFSFALLSSHLGLLNSPGDPQLLAALEIARQQTRFTNTNERELFRPESEYWPNWLARPGNSAIFSGCVFFAAFLLYRRIGPGWKRTLLVCTSFALMIAPNIGTDLVSRFRNQRQAQIPLRVTTSVSMLRTGNGDVYPPLQTVPKGIECRQLAQRGDWVQVEFGSGFVGWIRDGALTPADWTLMSIPLHLQSLRQLESSVAP